MAKKEVEKEIEPLDGQLKLDSNGETTEVKKPEKKKNNTKNSNKSKKTTSKKTEEKKSEDNKAEKKSTEKKPTEKKPAEKKQTEKKASTKNKTEKKPEDVKNEKKAEQKVEEKVEEKKTPEKKPEENKAEKKPSQGKAAQRKNSSKKKKEEKQTEEKKAKKESSTPKKAEPEKKVEKPKVEEKPKEEEKPAEKKQPEKKQENKQTTKKSDAKKAEDKLNINVNEIVSDRKSVSKKEEKNKALLDEAFAGIEDSLNDFNSLDVKPKPEKKQEKVKEQEKEKVKEPEKEKFKEKIEEPKKAEPEKKVEKPKEEKPAEEKKPKEEEKPQEEPSKPEENAQVITLPSKGSLKDIKGEEIEDFIEETSESPDAVPKTRKEKKAEKEIEEEVGIEPTLDFEPAGKNIKPLPRMLTYFVPIRGDGIGEIIRKGIVDICIVLLIVSMAILIKSTKSATSDESQNGNIITNYALSYDINSKTNSMPANILEKYYSLYNTNNNLVGWLTINDTQIDLPVLKYTDNSHYATYDYFEKALTGINAYADAKCNMENLGDVTVLYVAKSSQVSSINGVSAYKDSSANLSTIEFGTIYADMTWKLVACITNQDAINTLLNERSDRAALVKCVAENSVYEKNEDSSIDNDDQVLLVQIPDSDGSQIMLVAKRINEKSTDF